MKFKKEFIEDQFRGFETSRDSGNNVIAVRVTKNGGDIVAAWSILDSRHLDLIIHHAIAVAIEHKIVPAGTV
jgi:hypothetical protein